MRFLTVVILAIFSSQAFAVEPDAPQSLITASEAVGISISSLAAAKARSRSPQKQYYQAMAEFYSERPIPVWLEGSNFNRKAGDARQAMLRADEFGLNPADYSPPSDSMLKASSAYAAETLANAELEMSLAAVIYATHAQSGRVRGQEISSALDPTPDVPKPEDILQGIADAKGSVRSYLESYNPQNPQFLALKQRLFQIVNRDVDKKMAAVPAVGPSLRPGATHPDVGIVRVKLRVDKAQGGSDDFFDDALAQAVKSFQKQNGLQANGALTYATRRAFEAVPSPNRKLIIANMERWRWAPRNLGATHIRVNIPEFTVRLVRGNRIDFEERVVVGKTDQKTPVFSDEMEMVVFNPFWNVPESITSKEIIPIMRRNPNYIQRNGLEVFIKGQRGGPVDPYYVNWSEINPDRVFIRQPPGNSNALGNVKFLFPNKHSVYLHDTPSKSLFNQNVRAFSHGCVRVRNPRQFAEAILGWNQQKIDRTIASGAQDNVIQVQPRIPVHMLYFTAWVGERGDLQVFRDIYGHDAALIAALKL